MVQLKLTDIQAYANAKGYTFDAVTDLAPTVGAYIPLDRTDYRLAKDYHKSFACVDKNSRCYHFKYLDGYGWHCYHIYSRNTGKSFNGFSACWDADQGIIKFINRLGA